jgi:hypothetical protein
MTDKLNNIFVPYGCLYTFKRTQSFNFVAVFVLINLITTGKRHQCLFK